MRRVLPLLPIFPILLALLASSGVARPDDLPKPPSAPAPAPPPPAPATGAPKITIDRTKHDFGPAKQQDKRTTEFAIRNEGTAPLHARVNGDCGCTGLGIVRKGAAPGEKPAPSAEIEPGGAATVTLTFETGRFVGPIDKVIHVLSDDPARPDVAIQIHIDVSAGIVLSPQFFFFKTALVGTRPAPVTVEARWMDGVGKPFKFTSMAATRVQPAGTKIEFAAEPFDASPWHGYRVTMTFPEPPPAGTVSGTAVLETDDPETPRITADLGGLISTRVVVSMRRPHFGSVVAGEGATLSLRVKGFDASIDLGEVKATSQKGAFAAKVAPDPEMKGGWKIELSLPKDAPVGAIDDVLVLTTGVKGEERVELPVRGTVTAKAP